MTSVLEREELSAAATTSSPWPKLPKHYLQHLQQHLELVLAGFLACLTVVTRVWNLAGYPRWFTDEGVYTSQAWAVQYEHELAPYTYWYDHPPLGWIQIDGWAVLTGAWHRDANATVMVGREFMVVMAMASVVLTFVLARRLGLRLPFAFAAGLVYALSPLAVSFSRYVLLDNIAITWVLAAMVLALSPRRHLGTAAASGLCMGIAVLSKETTLLIAPAVLFLIWQNYRAAPNKWYAYILSASITTLAIVLYPLYALLKGELLPGPGHVSLWQGQVMFQLASRSGSGSILNAHSNSRELINNAWLGLDHWLPLLGVAAILPALFVRKLWGVVIALGVQVAKLFMGGYLPYPFIIAMLPFMALLVAGVADAVWPSVARWQQGLFGQIRASVGVSLVTAIIIAFVVNGTPRWKGTLHTEFTAQQTASQKQALTWVQHNLPHNARLVTEGELWLDMRNRGFNSPEVVWTYKVDTDPAVKAQYGNSITGLDYLVLDQSTIDQAASVYPTLAAATKGAIILATFGGPNRIVVMKVTTSH